MVELFVYQLRFEAKSGLEDAFQVLMDIEDLSACSIEPEELSARFIAPADVGGRLVEQMYHLGGRRWCSRHPIRVRSGGVGSGRASSV